MKKYIVAILVLTLSLMMNVSYAAVNDEFTVKNLDSERFSFQSALNGIQYMNDCSKSFRKLTKLTADRTSLAEKQQVGNLGWEEQNLGLYNQINAVEGAVYRQEYEIRKLEYELALERSFSGKTTKLEVAEKAKLYQEAVDNVQNFIKKFRIAD